MKAETKGFIKTLSKFNYPVTEKSELATKMIYSAFNKSVNSDEIKSLKNEISRIVDTNENMKHAYDEIVFSYLSKKDFKELNIESIKKFRSGPYINVELYRLVTKLLSLKNSDILLHVNAPDESFAKEASKSNKNNLLKLNTLIVPDNDRAAGLIKMRLDISDATYTIVDSIEKTKRFNPSKVFINPVYCYIDKNYRYSVKENRFWDDLLELSNLVSNNARVVALVPNVMLSNSLDEDQKKELLKKGCIEGIISLPLRYYSKSLKVETSLIILSKNNEKVKVVDASSIFTISDIKAANLDSITDYIFESYQSHYGEVSVEDLINKKSNLLISNIVTDQTYAGIRNPKELSKLADVKKGTKKTKVAFKEIIDQSNKSQYCLLSSTDITEEQINYDKLTRIIFSQNLEKYLVEKGDVVVTNKSSKVKIAVIERDDIKIIPVGSMLIIKPYYKELDGTYLKLFFNSKIGKKLIEKVQRGQNTNTLNPDDFKQLQISYIGYDDQIKLVSNYKKLFKILEDKLNEANKIRLEIEKLINEGGQNYGNE